MARAKLSKEDAKKVNQYLLLVNGIIDFEHGNWYIDTPDDLLIYHSKEKMMEDINYNLDCMKEVYENNNELDEWRQIEKQAEESKFHFMFESDRMGYRR